jgi:alpha-beta hydrolase superfamily lysophospholipase
VTSWTKAHEDVLGPLYDALTLPLGVDFEGPVAATLVRRRALQGREAQAGRAVLCLPGYNDYIFHGHVADFFIEHGVDFYGLDFRKCGRSCLPHQTRHLCRSLDEYFPEIDTALEIIRADGNERILLSGHSTGGLIAALWQSQARPDEAADGLFLNSPFLSSSVPVTGQFFLNPILDIIARCHPTAVLPGSLSPRYSQSLHIDYGGEWSFEKSWKSTNGTRLRAAWLAAVHNGQRQVRAGLKISAPILVMCSTKSCKRGSPQEEMMRCDAVLDVSSIVKLAAKLGYNVTCVQVTDAMHDILLSSAKVREHALDQLKCWLFSSLWNP